jgi:integrase
MARKKVGLTDAKVKSIVPPERGRDEHWDTQISGLKLRVSHTGKKVWYVWGRAATFDGAMAFQTKIGPYPAYGVHEARKLATDILTDASRGIRPSDKKAALKQQHADDKQRNADAKARRERSLFNKVVPIFVEDHSKAKKRTWVQDEQTFARNFLPYWGSRTLDEIETIEVADRLREIEAIAKKSSPTGKGYHAANRALAVLRKMYNWAIANGYATRSPITSGMSRGGVEDEQGSRKRDFLNNEIRQIWTACNDLPNNAAAAVKMLMLTGQRSGVVGGMTISEIDRDEMVWTIPADSVGRAKNKLEHKVPMTDAMMSLIDGLQIPSDTDHVFCSHHRGDKPLTIGSKVKAQLDEHCGFDDWTFQGLRGLVVTRMRRKPLRIDRDIVDLIEGRLPNTVQRRHYDSNDYMDEKREALERWNEHLRKITEDTADDATDNVVQITA